MKTEEFKQWLTPKYPDSKGTVSSRLSNCRNVEKHYGDLDILYSRNKCSQLLDELSYSADDEFKNLPAQHKIPINGNIREVSATLKQAVSLYVAFRDSLNEDAPSIILNTKKLDVNFFKDDSSFSIEQLLIDNEIKSIEKDISLNSEEKRALIKLRLGQSYYRQVLLKLWKGCCAVTGCANELLLIASHIKPYSECEYNERYDKFNGILLSPFYDRLFDSYLISFNNDGEMLFSNRISKADLEKLHVSSNDRLCFIFPENHKYLEYHRKKFYDLNNDEEIVSKN